MKKLIVVLLTGLFLLGISIPARATVLDFEDLIGNGSMPDPYQGIVNWEDGTWFFYDVSQPPYNPSSGVVRTYESLSDYDPSWDFLAPVVYNGSYFSGYSTATVQMDLYLSSVLVYSTGTFAPSSVPTFFPTGYSGSVDRVVINTPEPDYWVMDDLTYDGGTIIPEPATMSLLGLGLLGVFGLRKKRG